MYRNAQTAASYKGIFKFEVERSIRRSGLANSSALTASARGRNE